MGLLDLNDEGVRLGLGLLAAASPRADGAGTGQRLMEAVGSVDQWKAQQQMQKMRDMQMQYQQALMLDHQQKLIAEKRANELAARKQAELPNIFKAPSAGAPPLNVDSLLPPELRAGTPTIPGVASSAGGIDVQRALSVGYSPKEIEEFDKLRNIGLDKVERTVQGMDDNGKPVTFQLDAFGRKVGLPVAEWKAPIQVNQGNKETFVDPVSLTARGSLQKFQSPDSVASNAVAWANNAVSRERLAMDKAQSNKPQFHDGQWVTPPSVDNPKGTSIAVPGFQKPLGEGAKKTLSGIESLNGAIGEYLNELKDWGKVDFAKPDKRASMGTKYNNMMLQAKEAYNLGVLNGPDYEILQSVVTNPMSMKGAITSNEALSKQAEELSRIMSNSTAKAVRGSGSNAEAGAPVDLNKTVSLADIQATAKASGRTTAEVTAAMKKKGYTIGGM